MRFSFALKVRLIATLVVISGCHANGFAIEAVWVGGPAGSWTEPTNWSTGVVPGGTLTNVTIDDNPTQSSVVSLPGTASSITIGDVTIDAGDQLGLESGSSLTPRFVTVDGNLVLNAAASLRPTEFLWIQPNGHLSMTDNPSQTGSLVQSGSSSAAYWNQGRISGAGAMGVSVPMFNEGLIVGNLPGEILSAFITNNSNSNIGEMLATDGGSLLIRPSGSSATLYNSESGDDGLIQARHTGSLVRIENVTVVGGEISTAADEANIHGTVSITNATLRDVRLEGNINARQLVLQGTIENNTTLNYGLGSGAPIVYVSSPAVLSGTGRIELDRFGIDGSGFTSSFNEPILINDANHTIAGGGTIRTERFHFKNRGMIEAHPVSGASELVLSLGTTQTAVNSGVMRATNQASLVFSGTGQNIVFENYEGDDDGVIEADINATVRFGSNLTVRGGVLRSIAPPEPGPGMVAGKILSQLGNSATLRDVRLEGTIGDEFSGWKITGQIENTDVFRANEILIENDATLTGGGRVQLGSGLSSSVIRGGTNPVQFINEDNTIVGTGSIDTFGYVFKNRGTILAEAISPPLSILGNSITPGGGFFNSGLLKATNGATLSLQIQVTNFEGSAKGTIHADDQSFVRVAGVNGGVFSTEGSGEIVTGLISNPAFLRDVHNQGFLRIDGLTEFAGTMRNDGTIVNGGGDAVRFAGALARLTGTGTYGPQSTPMNLVVGQLGPTMFIHGSDHTIRGRGTISVLNGGFINEGTLIAEGNGSLDITLADGAIMRQQGTLMASQFNSLNIEASSVQFTNEGTMTAHGYISIRQQFSQPLEVINTAGATLRGRLGSLHLSAPADNPITFWNQQGGTIAGELSITFSGTNPDQPKQFLNSGLISPDGFHAGAIFMSADFEQDATGVLDFELGGPVSTGWFDQLSAAGNIQLDGTLQMSLTEGFLPDIGESYPILFSHLGSIAGTFDTFIPTPMSGKWMSLEYQPDQVLLHIKAITADFDGNGFVDGDDLDDWQLASQGGTAAGDADGDGDSDGRDFLIWQRQFGAGINPAATSVAVPEPSTLILLMFSIAGASLRRVR